MNEVLTIKNLTKQFGGLTAVNDVSISVEQGQIYGVIGPNGAGKTTVFNLVTGVYKPTSGNIVFNNREIGGMSPHAIAQLGCARTFQNLRLFKDETVFENVCIASQLKNAQYGYLDSILRTSKYKRFEKILKEKAMDLLDFVGLANVVHEKSTNLPYGQQRKLEIARALATEPTLLLFDEPAAGMNPDESLVLMDLISSIREQFQVTILLIEHHMEVVMGICDEISVLNFGTQIATGTPKEVQNNKEVIDAYLGQEADE